jgi:hypothetical protein
MDPRVVLDETVVRVDPGSRATVSVRILNPSTIVEGYTVEVLGEAADWALVLPSEVSVFPGDEAVVEVAFDPPASAKVAAGSVPFGVRVRSRVDADDSTVVEGDLEVGSFQNIDARLGPKTSRGRRSGKHHVDLTNWGNEEVSIEISATDPDENLSFVLKPPIIDLPIGSGRTAEVIVKGPATFFRGPNKRMPFSVTARTAGAAPDDTTVWHRDMDASFEQKALLPRWVMVVVPLLAILIGVAIWWQTRPEELASGSGNAADQAPATPATLTVAAAGPGAMTLTWDAVTGAESYNVLWVDPTTKDAPTPVVLQTTTVPGAQNGTKIEEGIDPNTEYCFQLQAENAAGRSPATTIQCATSLGASGDPAPGGLTVEYLTDDHTRATVSWTDATNGEGEHVVLQDGVQVATTVPGTTSIAVDLKPGPNCFQVFSKVNDQASEVSEQQCIDGPGGSGGTTTTGGTAPALGVVVGVFSTPLGDAGANEAAAGAQADLQGKGFDAQVANSLDYPGLPDGPDDEGVLWVYIGGFSSEADAQSFCDDHVADFTQGCLVFDAEAGA